MKRDSLIVLALAAGAVGATAFIAQDRQNDKRHSTDSPKEKAVIYSTCAIPAKQIDEVVSLLKNKGAQSFEIILVDWATRKEDIASTELMRSLLKPGQGPQGGIEIRFAGPEDIAFLKKSGLSCLPAAQLRGDLFQWK